jgi:hypothetical protein
VTPRPHPAAARWGRLLPAGSKASQFRLRQDAAHGPSVELLDFAPRGERLPHAVIWDMNGTSIIGGGVLINPGTSWHVLGPFKTSRSRSACRLPENITRQQ